MRRLKVATHGSAFRYERPQKGRFREFHQLDAEIIGAAEPQADVELLAFADQLLKELGIDGVILSSTRSAIRKPATRGATRCTSISAGTPGRCSEDSQARLERNPLRILDSKAHQDWPVVDSAPAIDDFLTGEAADFFAEVTAGWTLPASPGSARRAWCAGSIITATRRSSSSPTGWARKGR